jgi:hypothetical protein
MKHIPSYPKIMVLGSAYTENALVGDVIIQEKVDGSQFSFGINEDGELVCRSKGQQQDLYAPDKMFQNGVDFVRSLKLSADPDTYFYGEYLQKPKHNVLKYSRIPNNHIVLFDIFHKGKFMNRIDLLESAKSLGLEVVPELYKGELDRTRMQDAHGGTSSPAADHLKRIISTTESFLGGETVEGVVIKNYDQKIMLGGTIYPLFTKYVRESFKERHDTEWKIKKPRASLEDYVKGFCSEPRWQKAFQYLRDNGQLEMQARDIPKLIKRVQEDITEEEEANIRETLYNKFIGEIMRNSIKGLPEWWKEKLLENVK